MKQAKPFWPLIFAMAALKFFLPFLMQSPVYELHRDEYLYYQQALHPALGYLENPPLLPWLASLSTGAGSPTFWLKCWPSLLGTITLILSCLITAEFGGKKFAQLLTGLGLTTGAFMRMHFLFQPNAVDLLGWTLSLYFLVRYINSGQTRFIWLLFLGLAFSFWGKYSVVFLGAALLLSIALTRHRSLFREKQFYFAALFAGLLILPQLIWQYQHHWPVMHHMEELQATQLRYIQPLSFLVDQLLLIIPAAFIWITGLFAFFRSQAYRVIGFTYLGVLLLLLLAHGKNYYAVGIYPVLIAAGAAKLESFSRTKAWLRWTFLFILTGISALILVLLLPTRPPGELAAVYEKRSFAKTGFLKWEDQQNHALPQDFADMLGWKELAAKTENFYSLLPDSIQTNTIVYCRNYGQAGAIRYYSRSASFAQRVISDNGSFLLWIPDSLSFRNMIFVGRYIPDSSDQVFNHFRYRALVDSVSNPYAVAQGYKLVFFAGADNQAIEIAGKIIRSKKEIFGD